MQQGPLQEREAQRMVAAVATPAGRGQAQEPKPVDKRGHARVNKHNIISQEIHRHD